MDKYGVLQSVFGYDSFRPGQAELIDAITAGRDALGIMPTGGGKSICYQIPALLLPGITVVVSPLISLMQDQVEALRAAGASAACINSGMSAEEFRDVSRALAHGEYKIIYVAPERLILDGFLSLVARLQISLVVVDEAHCISEWGSDFRPSYLKIKEFLAALLVRPTVAAFTATATIRVRDDIVAALGMNDPIRMTTGFDRPNLTFAVLTPTNKKTELVRQVTMRGEQSGIVYCSTRRQVEKMCAVLSRAGFSATRYHAGLSSEERVRNQEDFIHDRRRVMVATNAFGMGIDKSNVSFVIHYNMPSSLEAYYQEAGRAGRDGSPADCLLFFSPSDIRTARFFILHEEEDGETKPRVERTAQTELDLARLSLMIEYCKTTSCLRGKILDYFGEAHPERCENCGNCRTNFKLVDITREAQMILSCVKRIIDRTGYPVGGYLLAQTMVGARNAKTLELGLDKLSTYGLMKEKTQGEVRDLVAYLEDAGYLETDPVHGGITLTEDAALVLFGGETVEQKVKATPLATRVLKESKQKGGGRVSVLDTRESALYDVLRGERQRIADEKGVPAYIIFTNAALYDMVRLYPKTPYEFRQVSGVGDNKLNLYCDSFLRVIAEFDATYRQQD